MSRTRIQAKARTDLEEAQRLFGTVSEEVLDEMAARFGRVLAILERWDRAEPGAAAPLVEQGRYTEDE